MEILYTQEVSETTGWAIFVYFVILIAVFAFMSSTESGISAAISLLFGVVAVIVIGKLTTIDYIEHEALVTDYNEVVDQGYEIIEQKGEITILRKEITDGEEK